MSMGTQLTLTPAGTKKEARTAQTEERAFASGTLQAPPTVTHYRDGTCTAREETPCRKKTWRPSTQPTRSPNSLRLYYEFIIIISSPFGV